MIFREYQIFSNGSYSLEHTTRLVRGDFNYLSEADSFLKEVSFDHFPTIEIQESDDFQDEKMRNVLQKMFFTRQLHFFVHHGWKVSVVDKDCECGEVETFGLSAPKDIQHAQEMGLIVGCSLDHYTKPSTTLHLVSHYLYNLGSKNFWIERWSSEYLVIHVTRKLVSRNDVISVTK